MTNPKRRILLIVITAVTAAFLLLPGVARGQEEPTPDGLQAIGHPVTFFGSATLNGVPAPDGMLIEALLGDVVCGEAATKSGEYSVRVLDGLGVGEDFRQGCNASEVVFRSGELIAAERGQYTGADTEELDLTFVTAASPTPPPQLPDTGYGASSSSGTRIPPWLLLALSATGIAAISAAAIARRATAQG